jgi:two-component system phosphate regulon sensor histidine kinase PhoR
MTARIFNKLLGLFILLLLIQTLITAALFLFLLHHTSASGFGLYLRTAIWSGLIALALARAAAAIVSGRTTERVQRVVDLAQRIAGGELSARIPAVTGNDEFAEMEGALNRTAERLDADFDELQRGRHELAAMLDAMQEGVVAITRDGLVRWSNAVMQRIAGTQIRPGRPLVHSVRDPEFLACVRSALERRELCYGRATSLAPGRIFEINAAPLSSGGALVVIHDVTKIEEAQKSHREFFANVSHELRTPLTSVQGYVETLLEEPVPDAATAREFLGIILKNASRMNRLTEDLLALASVESPDYKISLQPTPASTLVHDAIQSMSAVAVDAGVDLEAAGAPGTPVMADAYAMHQVFGNLIENSLKYARDGKRIRVGAKLHTSEVQFTIRDFGPGIASEHLDRIFERFYRVDKARSRESGGTGLGLAIVKHIVQAHGGRVWAESELGKGVFFHFTLPLASPEQPATEPADSIKAI